MRSIELQEEEVPLPKLSAQCDKDLAALEDAQFVTGKNRGLVSSRCVHQLGAYLHHSLFIFYGSIWALLSTAQQNTYLEVTIYKKNHCYSTGTKCRLLFQPGSPNTWQWIVKWLEWVVAKNLHWLESPLLINMDAVFTIHSSSRRRRW